MAQADRVLPDRLTGALPGAARLASDEETVFGRFQSMFDLRGARVIEIGGRLKPRLVEGAGVRLWYSVDPRNAPRPADGPVLTVRAPASRLAGVERGSVDLVFSCNAFQHVADLAETLRHVAGFVRPGGHLYANFGPIWSAPDGSHVENLRCGGRVYNFWETTLLPSWAQLVYGEDELSEVLAAAHGAALARCVARYVFHSTWINRLFFEDYLRAVEASGWRPAFVGGCEAFDYAYEPPAVEHVLRSRLEGGRLAAEVQKRHGPDKRSLKIRDVEMILVR